MRTTGDRGIHPATVVLALVALLAVGLTMLLPRMLGLRAGAPWIPDQPPVETNRIVHPDGFSMIPPPGWTVSVFTGKDQELWQWGMVFTPGSKGNRFAPRISARTTDRAPELTDCTQIEIDERPAWEISKRVGAEEEQLFDYRLLTQIGNRWAEVSYGAQMSKPGSLEIPAVMLLYLRSIRPTTVTNLSLPETH